MKVTAETSLQTVCHAVSFGEEGVPTGVFNIKARHTPMVPIQF